MRLLYQRVFQTFHSSTQHLAIQKLGYQIDQLIRLADSLTNSSSDLLASELPAFWPKTGRRKPARPSPPTPARASEDLGRPNPQLLGIKKDRNLADEIDSVIQLQKSLLCPACRPACIMQTREALYQSFVPPD
jgi:hypothetical protein